MTLLPVSSRLPGWAASAWLAIALCLGACSDPPAGEFSFAEGAPGDVGMNAGTLEGARTYAFAEGRYTQSVIVVRHRTIVAEWYAEDRDRDSPAASWSVGKSVTSALIGIALDRGEIPSLDIALGTYFPEFEGTPKAEITLRDVLEMTSGLSWVEDYATANIDDSDVAGMVLDTGGSHLAVVVDNELAHAPGTVFNYSSGDTMLLSRVLSVATGMAPHDYAEAHLFGPMGITGAQWWRDREGDTLTYCCLDMRSRDFARFGQLYLDGGELGGRRIVPEQWVLDSTTPSRVYEGYGYQWWLEGRTETGLPDDVYAALGHDGQFIYVIPSRDMVVVRNGRYTQDAAAPEVGVNLFGVYPSNGLFPNSGTVPPDDWDSVAFLAPILNAVEVED